MIEQLSSNQEQQRASLLVGGFTVGITLELVAVINMLAFDDSFTEVAPIVFVGGGIIGIFERFRRHTRPSN